jgi:hypothetical protein
MAPLPGATNTLLTATASSAISAGNGIGSRSAVIRF